MNAVIPLFILMESHYESQHHRQRAMNQLLSYEIKIESPPYHHPKLITLSLPPLPNGRKVGRGGVRLLWYPLARIRDNGCRSQARQQPSHRLRRSPRLSSVAAGRLDPTTSWQPVTAGWGWISHTSGYVRACSLFQRLGSLAGQNGSRMLRKGTSPAVPAPVLSIREKMVLLCYTRGNWYLSRDPSSQACNQGLVFQRNNCVMFLNCRPKV